MVFLKGMFLFYNERALINKQIDISIAFNSTSRYLDDLLNIDDPYFEQMVSQIH